MIKHSLYLMLCIAGILMAGCTNKTDIAFIDQADASSITALDVANKYIVVFKEKVNLQAADFSTRNASVKAKAYGLLKKYGVSGDIEEVYESSINGFTVKMAPGQAKKMEIDSLVKWVEADKMISLSPIELQGKPGGGSVQPPQQIPWGITRVGGGISTTISGTAWIIDTGIDFTHPDLKVDQTRSYAFLNKPASAADENGHGTHVAGIVAAKNNDIGVVGVAPGATLVSVRVLNKSGSGTTSGVIAGVNYVGAFGKNGDVANMSLGGGVSPTLDAAVIGASSVVKFVLAAGNESDDAIYHSPARAEGVNIYTISAMDKTDTWAYFSNYGKVVDFCVPGVSIRSTYKGSSYATLSGTSMATPHVTGLLLLGAVKTDGIVIGDPDGDPDPIAHH
jgi:subtilisin family serine protease